MSFGQKLISTKVNLDKASDYITESEARFIKNLTPYTSTNNSVQGITQGQNALNLHSVQSNELYVSVSLPEGENVCVHAQGFAQVNRVYVWVWNSEGNHCIYRINGATRTAEIVAIDSCFNFQLKPEYFIHEAGCWLEVVYVVDPVTNETIEKEDLYWTDGFNPQGYLRTNDCIATDTFNPVTYPYFKNDYDRCTLFRMGVPTPMDCITYSELPNVSDEINNQIKFKGIQFRVMGVDVWGRPTEHGIISDLYIWGGNNCSAGDNGARCLTLSLKVTNPIIDKLQIEINENNNADEGGGVIWQRVDIIDLYEGSNITNWWLRVRNPDIPFNQTTSTYLYRFCNDREKIILPTTETNRTENALSQTSQTLFKLNKNIAVGNNKYGYAPFSQDLMSNVSVELEEKKIANVPFRNIRIGLSVRNLALSPSPIYKKEDKAVYGGVFKNPVFPAPTFLPQDEFYYAGYSLINSVQQAFGNTEQYGFIGVLIGTGEPPITIVSEQYYVDPVTFSLVKVENYDNFDFKKEYIQVFNFNSLKAGKYIFQLCNPTSKLSDADYWKTSANLIGTYNISGIPSTNPYILGDLKNKNKQIVIDVCNGDYDFVQAKEELVVMDIIHPVEYSSFVEVNGTNSVKRLTGYIYETQPDINPVELLKVRTELTVIFKIDYSFEYTDQNGYYMVLIFYKSLTSSSRTFFDGFCQSVYKNLLVEDSNGRFATDYIGRTYILNTQGNCLSYYSNDCNRVLVKGKIVDCDTGVGISGVGVVLEKSQYAITDEDGNYTIVAHYDGTAPTVNRVSDLYFIQNTCGYTDCNLDLICYTAIVTFPIPNPNVPCGEVLAINSIPILSISILNITKSSHLLSGGQYGVALIAHDWLRRHNFAQTTDKLYFNVPTLAQSGGKYYSARVIINPNATFPNWAQLLTPAITEELTIEEYIDWVVDSFIFIDNSGEENTAAPTQIKIYYRSLNEYNKQNEFNTTTNFQFIVQETGDPRTGDYVDFLVNGDGTYFNQAVRQIVKYNKDGNYFLVNYDDNLKDLKNYARIRLIQPKLNNNASKIFYELCSPIKVIGGKAQQNSISLPAFDTYNMYRQIPIPNQDGEGIANIITFGTPFEHDSPNDLWGKGIKNIGRVFTVNPYEGVILRINEVALSGAMSANGVLNYLSYFEDDKKTNFSINNTGGISAGFSFEQGWVTFLTQYYSFRVGFNNNLATITTDGRLQVPSNTDLFGSPQPLSIDFIGCQLSDKNSIKVRDGVISFVDRNRGELFRVQGDKVDSYTKNKCDAWFREKCRAVSADPNRYFITGIDPITGELIVSDFSLTDKKYDNQLRTYDAKSYETVCFDMFTMDLRGWRSWVAENYAYLDGDVLNNNLFTFKSAQAYNHYNQNQNTSFNNFFGVQGGRVFTPVANGYQGGAADLRKKKFLSLAVYCKQDIFFSDQITTETGQSSYLMLSEFEQAEFFSFCSFMGDLNTPTDPNLSTEQNDYKAIDGNNLYGNFCTIRLVGNPVNDNNYCEIFGIIVEAFISEKTG